MVIRGESRESREGYMSIDVVVLLTSVLRRTCAVFNIPKRWQCCLIEKRAASSSLSL
jgi:hypothetical protein